MSQAGPRGSHADRRPTPWTAGRLARRLQSARRRGDAGTEAVEVAVTMPVVIMVVMASLQAGLYFHGRSVAQAAAQEGCRVAAASGGTAEAGHKAAQEFADQMGAGELVAAAVEVTLSDDMAQVTVSGTGMSLVPMWHPAIRRTSTCPVERVTW